LSTKAPSQPVQKNTWWRALPFAILAAFATSAGLLPPVGCGAPDSDVRRINDGTGGDAGSGGQGANAGAGGSSGAGGTSSTTSRPYTVEMWIETANLTLLSIEWQDSDVPSTPLPEAGDPALMWTIEDASGKVVDAGIVADPRVAHAEPLDETDSSLQDWTPAALLRVDTMVNTGTLIVLQQSPTGITFDSGGCDPKANEVGRVDLDGSTGGTGTGGGTLPNIPGIRKIVDHGDCAYNANLLIISDGFTSTEMDKFRQHAQNFTASLRNYGGFKDNWEQVNVWTLEVASKDSGISDPDNGITKNTAFGVAFGTGNNRRCVMPRNATRSATRLRSQAERAVKANSTVIIANSTEHGGCASGSLSTTTTGKHGPAVFAHELGHSLFNLADEYVEQTRCRLSRAGNRINTTKNQSNPPWKSLVNSTIEGAEYCEKGVYRAEKTCLMRSVGTGANFCTVCLDGANRWFANRKVANPDTACSEPAPPVNNCFGGESCPGGTVCSWNGEGIGYCCRAPFEGTKVCYTDEECGTGKVCSFGGPPNNFFYCTQPDQSVCVE
jgi:hypothetical protein